VNRSVSEFQGSPNPIAQHYARFRVADRLLLTGHSHQAWPDIGFEGQIAAWADAAELADEKWGRAEEQAERVRHGYARLLDDREGSIALGQNTHELLVRFLSALPLRKRPRIVTTDAEFHTARRQLDRLGETGFLEVVKVATDPITGIGDRVIAELDQHTSAVVLSSVLFTNAQIVPGLGALVEACRRIGAELLIDAYHQLNVVPMSLVKDGLEEAFVVGGGYKYCELGEGNCFLRIPPGRKHMRPIITGWFSEFSHLTERSAGKVSYGEGAARWVGSTYDPTSHYRAARVFAFFEEQGLTPALLREISQFQVGLLADRFDALDLDPAAIARDRSVPLERIGGFLALRCARADALFERLKARGLLTDFRGEILRLGPAPYLAVDQLEAAMEILGEEARALSGVTASAAAPPAKH
jgi:kynureninase